MESLLKDAHSRALINNKRVSAAAYMLFTEGKRTSAFENRFSVWFFEISKADARIAQKIPASASRNERPCTLPNFEFAAQTRFCAAPSPSVAVLKCLFEIGETDARSV